MLKIRCFSFRCGRTRRSEKKGREDKAHGPPTEDRQVSERATTTPPPRTVSASNACSLAACLLLLARHSVRPHSYLLFLSLTGDLASHRIGRSFSAAVLTLARQSSIAWKMEACEHIKRVNDPISELSIQSRYTAGYDYVLYLV